MGGAGRLNSVALGWEDEENFRKFLGSGAGREGLSEENLSRIGTFSEGLRVPS